MTALCQNGLLTEGLHHQLACASSVFVIDVSNSSGEVLPDALTAADPLPDDLRAALLKIRTGSAHEFEPTRVSTF
jgi:hypothetical protein